MTENSIFSVKVIPNKPISKIVDISDDGTMKIEIKAQPIEGKANQELIKYLAKSLGVNQNQVIIMRGANSKNKLIKIESIAKLRILDFFKKKIT
jgi:uncharacterized protein